VADQCHYTTRTSGVMALGSRRPSSAVPTLCHYGGAASLKFPILTLV